VFVVLVIIGSMLYSMHVEREIARDKARTAEWIRQYEQRNASTQAPPSEAADNNTREQPAALVETNAAPETVPDATEYLHTEKAARVDTAEEPEAPVSDEEIADVPVSPYGFGPYPELPQGWPSDTFPAKSANHELMKRVRIKLLSQGIDVVGTTMEDGLVYPVIKGTAYVKWKEYLRPTGIVRYISDIIAYPDDDARLNAILNAKGKSFTEADVPSDIKLVSFEEGAIDPYRFLDLQR